MKRSPEAGEAGKPLWRQTGRGAEVRGPDGKWFIVQTGAELYGGTEGRNGVVVPQNPGSDSSLSSSIKQ